MLWLVMAKNQSLLMEGEKKSWASIEVLFRRKWLKQEVLGTKEVKTIENEPLVHFNFPEITQKPVSFSSSFTWPLFQPLFTVLSIILFEKKLFPFSIIQILGLITTTWSDSFLLLLSLVTISVGYYFWGDEGVAMFEGGTWSSGLWPLSIHHLIHHLTMSRDIVGTYTCS